MSCDDGTHMQRKVEEVWLRLRPVHLANVDEDLDQLRSVSVASWRRGNLVDDSHEHLRVRLGEEVCDKLPYLGLMIRPNVLPSVSDCVLCARVSSGWDERLVVSAGDKCCFATTDRPRARRRRRNERAGWR